MMDGSLPLKLKWGKKSGRYDLSQDIYVLTVTVGEQAVIQCTLATASTAIQCIEYISQKMQLNQIQMFGLRYQMKSHDPDQRIFRWVELEKPLRRQLEKWACKPRQVQLAVLFHTPNAFTLTDQMARSFYFLMMKLDVVEGRLTLEMNKYISLAAYSLQVEYGPYDDTVHDIEFMQSIPLLPKQICRSQQILEELLKQVQGVYAKLRDMPPAHAALLYIVDAIQSEGYGEEYFKAKDEDSSEVKVGYSPEGIVVRGSYGGVPIKYIWSEIRDICASKRHLQVKLNDGRCVEYTMEDTEMCRYVVLVFNWQFDYAMSKAIEEDNTPVDIANLQGGIKTLKPLNSSQPHLALAQSNPDMSSSRLGVHSVQLPATSMLDMSSSTLSNMADSPLRLSAGKSAVKSPLSSVSFRYPISVPTSDRVRAASTAAFSTASHYHEHSTWRDRTPLPGLREGGIRLSTHLFASSSGDSSHRSSQVQLAGSSQQCAAGPSSSLSCFSSLPSSSQPRVNGEMDGAQQMEALQSTPTDKKVMGSSPEMRILGTSPWLSPLDSDVLLSNLLQNRNAINMRVHNNVDVRPGYATADVQWRPPFQSTPNLMNSDHNVASTSTSFPPLSTVTPHFLQNQRAYSDRQYNRVRSPEVKRPGSTSSALHSRLAMRVPASSVKDQSPTAEEGMSAWIAAKLCLPTEELRAEFTRIPNKRLSAGTSTSLKPENVSRNRTRSIVPYEDNRFTLRPQLINPTGYMNASNVEVTVGSRRLHYILTQAPLKETVDDFWLMVWESRVHVIVMLSEPKLDSSINSPIYWPLNASSKVETREVMVKFKSISQSASEVTTTLEMRCRHSGERRTIYHMRFVGWASGECPESEEELLTFMDSVRSVQRHVEGERARLAESNLFGGGRGSRTSTQRSRSSSKKAAVDTSLEQRSASSERTAWRKRLNTSTGSRSSHSPTLSESSGGDSGAPPSPAGDSPSPLLIHCHTGAHESGVYLLAEVAQVHIESNVPIDLAVLLAKLRAQRMSLVKNAEQYRFVLSLLAAFLQQSRLI